MAKMIRWEEADPKALEAWRASDEIPMRATGECVVVVEDFTFAWDPTRMAYFPTPNCRPGVRPDAL